MNLESFENIVSQQDVDVQKLLRELDVDELAIALSGAANDVIEKFYKNMSENAIRQLKDRTEHMRVIEATTIAEIRNLIVKKAATIV